MGKAAGEFRITSWNEDTIQELDGGGKLTHAWGEQEFSGDITGAGEVHWLMSYRADGTAHYVGLQRIQAAVAGRSGTLIIEATGEFGGTSSSGTWTIVEGASTDDLAPTRGSGTFEAPGGPAATYELDLELG